MNLLHDLVIVMSTPTSTRTPCTCADGFIRLPNGLWQLHRGCDGRGYFSADKQTVSAHMLALDAAITQTKRKVQAMGGVAGGEPNTATPLG